MGAGLTRIYLPSGLKIIGESAFRCSIYVEEGTNTSHWSLGWDYDYVWWEPQNVIYNYTEEQFRAENDVCNFKNKGDSVKKEDEKQEIVIQKIFAIIEDKKETVALLKENEKIA